MLKRRSVQWGIVFAVWAILALVAATQAYIWRVKNDMPVAWSELLPYQFTTYLFWALVTPPILYLSNRFPLQAGLWRRHLPLHFLFGAVVLLLGALYRTPLGWWFYNKMPESPISDIIRSNIFLGFYDGLWMYWTIVLVAHLLRYYEGVQERDRRASALQVQLSRAQLQALKTQLQPHFLFNTLHAITTLVHDEPERAETLLVRLSDLLRMSLDTAAQEVTLRQELEFLDLYLQIQKARFGNRLTVTEQIDANASDCLVPSMILQPLVENSVRHAIEPRAGGGNIEIYARVERDQLTLAVLDDGPGLNPNGNGKRREGIGLANTRARLQHLYGAAHTFDMHNRQPHGCEVRVQIPHRLVPESDEDFLEVTDELTHSDR